MEIAISKPPSLLLSDPIQLQRSSLVPFRSPTAAGMLSSNNNNNKKKKYSEKMKLMMRSVIRRSSSSSSSITEAARDPAPAGPVEESGAGAASITKVKAIASVQMAESWPLLGVVGLSRGTDSVKDLFGKTVLLELVSAQLDPESGSEKETIKGYARRAGEEGGTTEYEATFKVGRDFGEIGGVFVTNYHDKEMFLKEIKLQMSSPDAASTSGAAAAAVTTIRCNSWVNADKDNPAGKRLFFVNKAYLPAQTPDGLRRLRQQELEVVRGDGEGERKAFQRIYDYDVYNDLGDPDNDEEKTRPVLGATKDFPYPRRCRTGRPMSKKDPKSETRSSGSVYVPRDEAFSPVKRNDFYSSTIQSGISALIPAAQGAIIDVNLSFPSFAAVDSLFREGLQLTNLQNVGTLRRLLSRVIKAISEAPSDLLQFKPPDMIERDRFSWLRNEEWARQTLAGMNPYAIELLKEFPPVSKLDPEIYGPPESSITAEMLEDEINGVMTVPEAMEKKRLFILDYHDLFLPYVQKVRELENTTLYGSRTIFFLNDQGTLKPIAIELTRPPTATEPQRKRVFRPHSSATRTWLWNHARSHVRAHDSCHHELISHWLRTHCAVEPYIIAAHRQLSEMHPIFQLLHPHFRYTMAINALARQNLINAGGIIEVSFSPLKYSMEISSVAYDQLWRFDMEALPADLIRRGMAVEDPTADHGLRLTIEDYPFANDGLLIWFAIKQWVEDYVSHYYPNAAAIADDVELQAWWDEVRTKGHADKKDEPWWPKLNTLESLTQTLTTVVWVASAHHAAVNFGQYDFASYFPNRPSIARTDVPSEDENNAQLLDFLNRPEDSLLSSLPSQIQATVVMAVLNVLSNHSVDEEYLSAKLEAAWVDNPPIHAAYDKFNARMKEIDEIIDKRNCETRLQNRFGAGVVPYKLMKPFSEPGVTNMGIPNSISI